LIIAIGSDHRGVLMKAKISAALEKKGMKMADFGAYSADSVDYPDIGKKVAEYVQKRRAKFGILICGSGVGMSIAANKVKGIRAALCFTAAMAEMARRHNDANIVVFGADVIDPKTAVKAAAVFINTAFDGGRHAKRVNKIKKMEKARG